MYLALYWLDPSIVKLSAKPSFQVVFSSNQRDIYFLLQLIGRHSTSPLYLDLYLNEQLAGCKQKQTNENLLTEIKTSSRYAAKLQESTLSLAKPNFDNKQCRKPGFVPMPLLANQIPKNPLLCNEPKRTAWTPFELPHP